MNARGALKAHILKLVLLRCSVFLVNSSGNVSAMAVSVWGDPVEIPCRH